MCVCVCVCKRFRLRTPVWGEEETAAEERCTRKNKTYMYVTVRKATGIGGKVTLAPEEEEEEEEEEERRRWSTTTRDR